jgi:sugar O-acyltransferase (sialic acid O-acetyltransferase NeuD family)
MKSVCQLSTDNLRSIINDRRVVLLGAGGHAKVLLDTLTHAGVQVEGVVDPLLAKNDAYWRSLPVIGNDDDLLKMNPSEIVLVNGVGNLPGKSLRQKLFRTYKAAGFNFLSVVHSSSLIGTGVNLGEGVQLMAGTIVQADCSIGDNSIVNTGASIDHDCCIGDHVHVAPGATLSGNVSIGKSSHIGTGATIIQDINIGRDSVVGAGSVVLKNVPDGVTVYGVPAKVVKR